MPNTPLPSPTPPLRPRGSNHVGMRAFNERVVLQAIRLHGALPKAEVARLTGLTAQTVGLITTRLEDDGLLLRHERVRGRVGQPSVPLALNPDGAFSIGLKIGRRSADWLLVDFTGQVRQRRTLDYAFPDAEQLFPAIATQIQSLRAELSDRAERLVGVGVAAPFQLGGWHRMLGLSHAQSQQWNHIDLRAEVQNLTELPVIYAKDTVAACVAELLGGRGRDIKSFLYLFIDTFVGGALVLNSRLHYGLHGNAGAVASLPLGLGGQVHTAPQTVGHASLWDLEQRFLALELDPHAVYDERALLGPYRVETLAWIITAANALAHCIVSGTAFLDLDAVVLDGSFDRAVLEQVMHHTRLALHHYSWEGLWRTELVAGTTGADARALGGAMLPLHTHFAPDQDLFLKVES